MYVKNAQNSKWKLKIPTLIGLSSWFFVLGDGHKVIIRDKSGPQETDGVAKQSPTATFSLEHQAQQALSNQMHLN